MGASGVLGDPSAATAELGERFLAAVAGGLAAVLDTLAVPNPGEENR